MKYIKESLKLLETLLDKDLNLIVKKIVRITICILLIRTNKQLLVQDKINLDIVRINNLHLI